VGNASSCTAATVRGKSAVLARAITDHTYCGASMAAIGSLLLRCCSSLPMVRHRSGSGRADEQSPGVRPRLFQLGRELIGAPTADDPDSGHIFGHRRRPVCRNDRVATILKPTPTLPRSGRPVTFRPEDLTFRNGYRVEAALKGRATTLECPD